MMIYTIRNESGVMYFQNYREQSCQKLGKADKFYVSDAVTASEELIRIWNDNDTALEASW